MFNMDNYNIVATEKNKETTNACAMTTSTNNRKWNRAELAFFVPPMVPI
jgi:hypothetical protein